MKTFTTISLIILISSNIFGQNTETVNLEKMYSFVNSTMTNDSIKFNLNENTGFGIFIDDTLSILSDSLFNDEDRAFFREQFALLGKIKWEQDKISGATIIPKKDIKKVFKRKGGWERFRKKYGNCLTSFSLPIFSANSEYCIIYRWTQCDYLAGGGSTDLYKFDNGKWIFIQSYSIGMS